MVASCVSTGIARSRVFHTTYAFSFVTALTPFTNEWACECVYPKSSTPHERYYPVHKVHPLCGSGSSAVEACVCSFRVQMLTITRWSWMEKMEGWRDDL